MAYDQKAKQALAGLFSVDAWHVEFNEAKRADLFVDVVFKVAKMGGDGAAPVKFTVRLKRAEIVVLMPAMGEFKVDPATIARLLPGEATLQSSRTVVKEAHAAGEIGLAATGVSGSASAGAKASLSQTDTVNSSEVMRAIVAQHGKTHDGHYSWELGSSANVVLSGPVWDAPNERRFEMLDKRSDKLREQDDTTNNQPVMRVQVRCRREDLKIDDIEVTDEERQGFFAKRSNQDKRMAAAESFIRDALIKEGLMPVDLSGEYVELILADCMVEKL